MLASLLESVRVEHPAGILAVLLGVLAVIFWLVQHAVFGRIFKVVPALVFCYFVPTALTTAGILPAESPLYSWIKSFVLPAALLLLILALDLPGIMRLGPKALIMVLAGTTGVVLGGPLALWICRGLLPANAWQGMTALAGSWIGGGANFVALGDIAGASSTMMAIMVVPDVLVANIWMGVLLYLSAHQHRIDGWTGANAQAIRELERRLSDFQERVRRVTTLPDLMMIVALGFVVSWVSYVGGQKLFATTSGVVREVGHRTLSAPGVMDDIPLRDVRHMLDAAFEADVDVLAAGPTVHTLGYGACRLTAECPVFNVGDTIYETHEDVIREAATAVFAEPSTFAALDVMDIVHGIDVAERAVPSVVAAARSGSTWYPIGRFLSETLGASTWKYVLVTTIGILLSLTAARNLEGAGASRVGSVLLYLLVACIGASANFQEVLKQPAFFLMGFVWMSVHIAFILGVGYLIRAPIFFVAVGSQANIGGAASAPVVAAAYHPSLAPVGALLAILGYVLGTYAGLVCMHMLKAVAGAS
ncbi:MAG: DUF819 family protein [Phycisphaerae bacterium]|jgi:uncharacterized membrane protein